MMILDRGGAVGGSGGHMCLFLTSPLFFFNLFFFKCHTRLWRREAEEVEGERGGGGVAGRGGGGEWWSGGGDSSMTNFPFFYGGINLTGWGEEGELPGRVEILLAR